MNDSPRRRLIGLTVALIVALALLQVWRVATRRRPPAAIDAERRGRTLAAQVAQHAPSTPRRATPAAAAPTAPAAAPSSAGLARATADAYRQQARYPHSSHPISDPDSDPILRDRDVSPSTWRGPGDSEPSLTVFPEQVSFEDPDAVILYAYLSVAGTAVPAQSMSGTVIDAHGETVASLAFNDDGRGADAQANDFVYTAQLATADANGRRLSGAYLARVHAVSTTNDDRFGTSGFLYSRPDAQLTGRYTDAPRDGSLEIRVEVEVTTAGRFHLEATLYTLAGRPLAWAQNALPLSPGRQWIPLTFFGLVLREQAADGPYVLRYVALSTTTEMPNAKNRLVENAYVTRAYRAADFSDQPFNDANLLETARRLEASAPPATPSGAP